ncbi:MBL fold metallo-hydrolase [Deinococcus sp. KSM4-11]|uniref:MBL fold metallo-hydrolase n=1 Tax=Deinococcus sp. KSM4-11 TaxID=2568654 RepID=UPI0010A3B063|nr:MBL fold metallo-hydrolase [Deinococcus sp. KSM4-11]THF89011.1 MBL fold metallo-hydrolase [Deinococcus sp. KSM4-11]
MPGVIASYVFDTGDGLAVVDTGPTSTLGPLEAGLAGLGATLDDVRHLLLTHIHFDHAGAAGTILARVPFARAYVHERGAPHLASPERLYASARQIYGEHMERLWGEMRPIDPERLTILNGGETLKVGTHHIQVAYTPGHAVHHVTYRDGPELYVGDVAGVRLTTDQTTRAPTPPPDIDLERWRDSVSGLRAQDVERLHLAHFGTHAQEPAHWDGLLATMDIDAGRVRAGLDAGQDFETISAAFSATLMAELAAEGPDLPARYDFACPPWMSVQGLMRYWQRRAARPQSVGD